MGKRQESDHTKLDGVDVNIEISLKEYGIAWIEDKKTTLFYYGIRNTSGEYDRFDFCEFDNDLDVVKEFDWVDFDEVCKYIDVEFDLWEECSLSTKIVDLNSYYGYENVFGSTYHEGITYEEIFQ